VTHRLYCRESELWAISAKRKRGANLLVCPARGKTRRSAPTILGEMKEKDIETIIKDVSKIVPAK
jgi:hypothetical protein